MADQLSGHTIVHLLATVHHGGAERVVLELAHRQQDMGARVQVICLQQLGELLPAFDAAHIAVSLVPGGGLPGALRMGWRVGGVLQTIDATVVHTHNVAPQIAAGLGQRLRRWRRPGTVLIHTEHGRLGDVRPGLLRWRRWTIAEFDTVIAVSADAQEQLLQHGIRSAAGVDVIRNGVDLSRFVRPEPARAPGARIVHVGRLSQIKGQDVLIAAMPRICRDVPAAHLTIVGDGPTRAELEDQARRLGVASAIEFVGSADDVRPYLRNADLFVLPSRSEGISLALLEAMATGLAVVATDVGGNREVLRIEAAGVVVPSERPDELAAATITLLRAPDALRAMGTAARAEVERHFSSEMTVQAYARHYGAPRRSRHRPAMRSAA